MEACVGEDGFNKVMIRRLDYQLKISCKNCIHKHNKGLEIMAGPGRNIETILKWCKELEVLDSSEEMLKHCPDSVKKHHTPIQHFNWPQDHYDVIVGVWFLSYLDPAESLDVLAKIHGSLKENGSLILFEPIL